MTLYCFALFSNAALHPGRDNAAATTWSLMIPNSTSETTTQDLHLLRPRRYIVLVAGIVMQACLGGIYAWSAFVGPLQELGYSAAQTQAVFGIAIATFSFLVIVTGPLQDRFGPRPLACISAILLCVSYVVAGRLGGSMLGLCASIGVLGGLAIAIGYICPVATLIKWFPRHKGLVCGLAVAGYGGGAIVLSAIVETLLARGWFVLDIFLFIGLIYGPVVLVAGSLLFVPGKDASRWGESSTHVQVIKDSRLWLLFMGMLCTTAGGLGLLGNLKPAAEAFGMSVKVAAMSVGAFAVGNMIGRVAWGVGLDRLGGKRVVMISMAGMGLAVPASIIAGGWPPAFMILVAVVGFCYGGCFAIYPALVAQLYGPAVVGRAYGIVIIAQGLSALGAPAIGGMSFDHLGTYTPGLLAAAVPAWIGLMVFWRTKRLQH